jgi:hypothetical protein
MTHAMIIVLRDPDSGTVRKTIVLQYIPTRPRARCSRRS